MDKRFVDIDEAIEMAASLIPGASSFDRAIARSWAYHGLRDIGPGIHWFEDCVLYPNAQLSMRKPDDMYKPLDVALFSRNEDGSLSELRYSFKGRGKRIHTSGNPILDSGEYSPDHHAPIDLSEDAHFFHLGSNARGRVYCAKVKYLKLPIDAYGNPMVPEHQVLAIALFTRYMWTFANSTGEDRKLSHAEYLKARAEARAKGNMPNGLEFEQAAKEWNSMLNAFQSKQF